MIFIFKVERFSRSKNKRTTSRFFLVDLADSELVRKPGAGADKQTVHVFKSVKKSLGALRKCLHAMAASTPSHERPPSPYDDSSLTKLLRDSLIPGSGGVSLFVTVDKSLSNVTETLSAIRFGMYAAGHSSAGGENDNPLQGGEGYTTEVLVRKDEPTAPSVASTALRSQPSTATPTTRTTSTTSQQTPFGTVGQTPMGVVVYEGLKVTASNSLESGKGSHHSVSIRTWRGAKVAGQDDADSTDAHTRVRLELEALRVENQRLTIANQHLNQELTKYRKEGRGEYCRCMPLQV